MNILLVQPIEKNNHSYYEIEKLLKETQKITLKHSVDLVVFPEGFLFGKNPEKCWDDIEEISLLLNCPTIIGFSTVEGREDLYYYNPHPQKNDTPSKNYIKHSTAESILFDYDLTFEESVVYYSPIYLKDLKIQVNICHDMFFPIIMERLEKEGLDILINITGGNVKMSKWTNILRGRSIEIESFVLCTMSNRTWMKQPSDRIAYHNGQRVSPVFTKGTGSTTNAFSIFNVSLNNIVYLNESPSQYSTKSYDELTIGLSDDADITIQLQQTRLKSKLEILETTDCSYLLQKKDKKIRVHIVDADCLFDRLCVFNQPHDVNEHHIFVYTSEIPLNKENAISLLKLRVIENRIAGVILSPHLKIAAKTNRYKDIQLFEMSSSTHKIGLPLEHMNGFDSIYQKNSNSAIGIPLIYKTNYEDIIKKYDDFD